MDDVYEDFYKDRSLFELSHHYNDSRFYDPDNKKVTRKMKDEVRRKIINEFVGLKPKMYSLVTVDDKEIRKAKVVNKNTVDCIRHKEYTDVLFGRGLMRHSMKRIQSKLHRIGTYNFCKFFCHVWMIDVIFLMMVLIVWLIFMKIY